MRLIYFTVGHDKHYLTLLAMCIESLRKYGRYTQDIHVFIPKDEYYEKSISDIDKTISVSFYEGDSRTNSSASKLLIFKKDLRKYEKVLFLDCDILVVRNIDAVFNAIGDKIAVSSECLNGKLMTISLWGGLFLNDKEKEVVIRDKVYGVNAGVFGFRPTEENLLVFEEMHHISKNSTLSDSFLEQPVFNYILFKTRQYERSFQSLILHRDPDIRESLSGDIILIHFLGEKNPRVKIRRMKPVFPIISNLVQN